MIRVGLRESVGYILARVIASLGFHGFALIFGQGMKDFNHQDLEKISAQADFFLARSEANAGE